MIRPILILLIVLAHLNPAFSQNIFSGEELSIHVNNGNLKGTLTVPDGARTLLILHSGSGPTDRDGNQAQMKNNSLKMLSNQLNEGGLATFRYDKRGIGQSSVTDMREENISVDTFVNDLRLWIAELENTGNYDHIWLAGHSEGALIGTLASQDNPSVKGFISIAGTGRPADQILREQLKNQPPFVLDAATPIIDSLKEGHTVDSVPVFLNAVFRKSVQPYIISWFKYDPSEEIRKLDMPVLIIQGGSDLQVNETDAKLLDKAAPDSDLVLIQDMNHVLKKTTETQLANQISIYMDPDLPLHPDLSEKIIEFIKKNN